MWDLQRSSVESTAGKKMRSRERRTSYNQQPVTAGESGLSNFFWVEQSFITRVSDVLCLQRARCESSYPSFSLINASEIGNPGISLISVGRKDAAAQRDHGILSVSTDWLIRCWSSKLNFSRTRVWPHTFLRNLQPQEVGSNFNFWGLLEPSGQISCSGQRIKGWRQRVQVSEFLLHILISTVTASAWLQFWCVWPWSHHHWKPLMERLLYIGNGIGSGDTWRHKTWP